MPSDASDCPVCARIARLRRDPSADPLFLAELAESFVVLHDQQRYEGWCVLLLKEHYEHLAGLPVARQLRLFEDVARVARAITRACRPDRINYECLGNQLHHVHWHVIPRYHATDPDPRQPVWTHPPEATAPALSADRRDRLVGAVRSALDDGPERPTRKNA